MKKILIVTSFILANLCLVNTVDAQFNFPAKKKPTNAKDTVAPATNILAKDAPKKVETLVDSNAKPGKNYDTTIVGGFNAKTQKSLRNNYAFFSETSKRKGVQERIPLPYQNLREEDAMFTEFIWEEIDGREKLNRPFVYQAYDDNGDQRFFAILLRAIEKDQVVAFSAKNDDDRFTQPISSEQVNDMLKGQLDTTLVKNVDNPNIYDTSIGFNAIKPDSIYTFRLKEQWIFDKKTSRMYCRIIGIAPIATIVVNEKPVKRTMFWLYYPELRASLAKNEVYNPKNNSTRITWEELFESRYFNSYIIKSSMDNYNDKFMNSIYKDPYRRLQEGEKMRQKIFDYEQDRWVY